jgi:DNA-binding HxlR family transcriptional regulator
MALKLRRNLSPDPAFDCPVNEAVDSMIGGAWTPTIIWNLGGGPRRFGELRRDLPGISAKVLTTRLRDLAEKGVVERVPVPDTSPPSVDYRLSDLGLELRDAIERVVSIGYRLAERLGDDFPFGDPVRLSAQEEHRVLGEQVRHHRAAAAIAG